MKTVVSTLVMSASLISSASALAITHEGLSMNIKPGNSPAMKEAPCPVYAEVEQAKDHEIKRTRGNTLEGFGIDDVRSYSLDSLNKLSRR